MPHESRHPPAIALERVSLIMDILPISTAARLEEMEEVARETMGWLELGQAPNMNDVRELCAWVLKIRPEPSL